MKSKPTVHGVAAAAAVFGASSTALAGPCTMDTLDTYISGVNNGCTVLDKTITGVSVGNVPADDVTATPVLVADDPGLKFSSDQITAGNGETDTYTISFTITAPPSNPMTDASLVISGESLSANTSFQDSETLSNGKSLLATNSQLTATPISFAMATSLTVTNNLSITNEGLISDITNQFSETPATVPEPSSLVLLGVGLSALGFIRRQKRRHGIG